MITLPIERICEQMGIELTAEVIEAIKGKGEEDGKASGTNQP